MGFAQVGSHDSGQLQGSNISPTLQAGVVVVGVVVVLVVVLEDGGGVADGGGSVAPYRS